MTKREIMVRAHELARTMTGDYSARLALGLRQAWFEARSGSGVTTITRKTRGGKEYTVEFGWTTTDRTIWADGHKVTVKEKGYVFNVTSGELGPVDNPWLSNDSDHGPSIIGQIRHNGKLYRLVLQIDDATFETLKAARKERQTARTTNVCPDCGTACYSDCKAS